MGKQYYVNGQWTTSQSGEEISIICPYTQEAIGSVPALEQEEVNLAVKGAKAAQGQWASLSIRQRGEYLNQWATYIEQDKEELAKLIMQEIGKGYKDSLKEVERTADLIRYTVEEAIHLYGDCIGGEHYPGGSSNKIGLVRRVPLGVVLAISPFNYPVNLAAAKIAPALITGNTVVFKPPTQGALSGMKLVDCLHRAEIPSGIINVVTGKGSVIGDYLVQHEDIDFISFTGGTNTGRRIAGLAKMIPMVMELGGKDPAIVCADSDLSLVTKQIVNGAYSYSGQRCTAIKRVLVEEQIADELVAALQKEVSNLTVGSPEDDCMISPLIDEKSADFVQGLIDDGVAKGATVLVGNKREGNLIYPTLLDHVTEEMKVAWEEPFGPVLPIIRVRDLDEAISMANKSQFGLQASIFTNDINKAFYAAKQLQAGTVQINGKTERGPDHFPFLGVKNSGMGVQGIKRSIESMTREKVTVINLQN